MTQIIPARRAVDIHADSARHAFSCHALFVQILWRLHAGTAVGVATAFGAPIGGLLFAFEELAASFSQALGWQIFFACMLAVLVSDTLRSAQRAVMGGEFGLFEGAASTILYEASFSTYSI